MTTTLDDPSLEQKVYAILKASRPPGWIFGPVLFSIGLAHSRRSPKKLSFWLRVSLQIIALSLPLCIVVFGVNDVYDYDSDQRNPRKVIDGVEGTVLHPIYHPDVIHAAYASSVFIMGSAMLNMQANHLLITLLLIVLGWQYSAPPFRLKEKPVLDSLSNGCIVLLAWLSGFCFPGRAVADAPVQGYVLSLCTAGIHALGAVVDTEADLTSGQKTISVELGKRSAAAFSALCYFVASWTVDVKSIFGAYVWAGLVVMLVPCIDPNWAHRAFQVIVYFSICGAISWCIARVACRQSAYS